MIGKVNINYYLYIIIYCNWVLIINSKENVNSYILYIYIDILIIKKTWIEITKDLFDD